MKTLLLMAKKGLIINFIVSPLMFIGLLILKLTNVISWNWIIVISPLSGIPFGLIGLLLVNILIKKKGDFMIDRIVKRYHLLEKMGLDKTKEELITLAIQIELPPEEVAKIGSLYGISKEDIYKVVRQSLELE